MRILTHCLIAVLAIPAAMAADANELVAKMGAVELRQSDIQRLAESQGIDLKNKSPDLPLVLEQLVRTELVRRHVLAEARQAQWEKRSEVQSQFERARDQILVTSYMNHLSRAPAGYPSESEITAAYDANKARFTTPPQYRVAQIYIAASGNDMAAAERKADDAWKKAGKKNADFAELARTLSDHKPSAEKRGELGWLSEDQLSLEFRPILQALLVGEVSKPVKSSNGLHVLKLMERKPASVRPLSEVRDALVGMMRLQRARENERDYMNKLAEKNPATVNEIALSRLIEGSR